MRNESLLPVALVLGLAASACVAPRPGTPSPSRSAATVEVENNAWRSLNIYAVSHGVEVLLGRVDGTETRSFTIPVSRLTGAVQLMATPIGSRVGHVSEPVVIAPGQVAHWTLLDTPGAAVPRQSMMTFTTPASRTNMARGSGPVPR